MAETHSALLQLAVHSLIAEDALSPDDVVLHRFDRGPNGVTRISTGGLDKRGAYGDWPEDSGQLMPEAESRYLDAAEAIG